MFPPTINFPKIDNPWSNEMSPFSNVNPSDETSSGFRTIPESGRRSSSPELMTPTDNYPLDNVFSKQQTYPFHRTSAPFPRQQVSYLPETVNAAWQTMSHRVPAFEKSLPPRRYVFEAAHCCATPRIRVVHDCCNKESNPRELLDDRPVFHRRAYPSSAAKLTLCRFCLKNGEPPSVYYSHNLHAEDGRVSCPVLRRYDCPICNSGGGDYAHTVRYCPALRANIMR